MGHRANLLLVDETGYKLFYCHWCAKSIPEDVFWGPQYAILFISQQRAVNAADGWLDDIWAEGGVIVDTSRNTLLLWGGESLNSDIPLRRMYLELLQQVWKVWKIQWAHDGIVDLANYVAVPRDKVQNKDRMSDQTDSLAPPRENGWTGVVGSVVFEDGTLRLFPLDGLYAYDYLETGPSLVEVAERSPGVDTLPLHEWTQEFPQGGFHIDIPKKQVAFWGAYERGGVEQVIPAWSGWEVMWLKDNYEYQLEHTNGRLTLPSRSTEELLAQLERLLLRDTKSSMVDTILKFAEEDRKKGHDVQINSYALRDDPLELSLEVRRQILSAAISSWKARNTQ